MARKGQSKQLKTQGNGVSDDVNVSHGEVISLLIEDVIEQRERVDHLELVVAALVMRGGMLHGDN